MGRRQGLLVVAFSLFRGGWAAIDRRVEVVVCRYFCNDGTYEMRK